MILVYVLTLLLVGPLALMATRGGYRRRILLALAVVAVVWCAETIFIVLVGDKPE
jgi:hypothetical protein